MAATTYNYGLLSTAEEDNIHQQRLLSVEIKPMGRITSRLLKPDSLINQPKAHLPTPPPEGDDEKEGTNTEALRQKIEGEKWIWREECTLDFEPFQNSILRMQLLNNSNERERRRYGEGKEEIQKSTQNIRDNTIELRGQLEEAQAYKARRLEWDKLAAMITANKALKPREEQIPALQKAEEEIADLERESTVYAQTWIERREQFGRIVEEGRQMLRLIRDEKEEAERKEGMEGGEDGEDGEGIATPRPEGGMTPGHTSQEGDSAPTKSALHNELLAPPTPGKSSASNRASPARSTVETQEDEDDENDEGEIEDGEAREDGEEDEEEGESMDVS